MSGSSAAAVSPGSANRAARLRSAPLGGALGAEPYTVLLFSVTIGLGLLMVSNVRFRSFKELRLNTGTVLFVLFMAGLAFASVPVLNAIGLTVGPGALLCLAFAAMLSGRRRAP